MEDKLTCPYCSKPGYSTLMSHIKQVHKIDKNQVLTDYPDIKLCTDEYSDRMSAQGTNSLKKYWSNPEQVEKHRERARIRFIEMNKDPEYKARISKKSSERLTKTLKRLWQDEAYAKSVSRRVKAQHADADGVLSKAIMGHAGRKRYTHTKPDGTIISMRSTWEIKTAKYLDINNIEYMYEPFVVPYNKTGKYYPDFYLPNSNIILEVKPAGLASAQVNIDKMNGSKSSGYKFMFVTEYNIDKLDMLNLK